MASTCIVCGCTEQSACFDSATGETCRWMMPPGPDGAGVCSFCLDPDEVGLVVLGVLPYQVGAPRIPLEQPIAELIL